MLFFGNYQPIRQWMLLILSKLPDLAFIDKFLIVISVLFALNLNMQSSGFGMTSSFTSVFTEFFLQYCGVQHPPPNVTLPCPLHFFLPRVPPPCSSFFGQIPCGQFGCLRSRRIRVKIEGLETGLRTRECIFPRTPYGQMW